MTNSTEWILEQCEAELEGLPDFSGEILQHLAELGYLSLPVLAVPAQHQVQKAKDAFEADLWRCGLFPEDELVRVRGFGRSYFLRNFLRRMTDIDEGVQLSTLPQRGEQSLSSRLLHYRLDLMGLWELPISTSLGTSSLTALAALSVFAKCPELEALNLLGNIEQFTARLLRVYDEEQFILCFRSPRSSEDMRGSLNHRNAFGRQLKADFGERTDYLKFLQKHVFNNRQERIDYGFLEQASRTDFNAFLIRLIQIHQWQEGFYNGLLDSDLGDLSLQSFIDAIDFYNSANEKDIKMKRFLTYLGQDYFMFNALFFLTEYMVEEEKDGTEEFWSSLAGQLAEADDETQSRFTRNVRRLMPNADFEAKPENGLLKRIYFGARKLLQKAFRFIQKICRWVADKLEQMWSFLKKLFSDFFGNLEQGLRMFVNGLRFLLGRKVIATGSGQQCIVTQIRLDGDISNIALNADSLLMERHLDETREKLDELNFSLRVTGEILRLVIQSLSIICWPLLLFSVVKGVRQIHLIQNKPN